MIPSTSASLTAKRRSGPTVESADILQSELAIMVYWIRERESIRKKKEAGLPKPWTTDALLRDYRWCNVSRMDDRVSRELFGQWYVSLGDRSPSSQLTAAALGRLCNWPEALLDANDGRPYSAGSLQQVRRGLHARSARGAKVWTGAYVVPGVPGRSKVDSILDLCELIEADGDALLAPTLVGTWSRLKALPGLGSFLAGQIAADVAQMPAGESWHDRFSWAPVGPGSTRGINRLHGRSMNTSVPQPRFDNELTAYIDLVAPRIAEIQRDRSLCHQDFQSTLCEFDKYRRLTKGEGTVRARYDGGHHLVSTENQLSLFSDPAVAQA